MEKLLQKLSLVIPTYNRPSYVLRNMQYWYDQYATVYILDGSEAAISSDELIPLSYNVHYYHLPLSYLKRLEIALNLVKTQYVALLSDDEFYTKSGLIACIKELESDSSLISCNGVCQAFSVRNQELYFSDIYPGMENHSLLQESGSDRMISHFSNYFPSIVYGVNRTEFFKKACKIFLYKEFSVYSIFMYQFELAMSYMGKSKIINELLWLRSTENKTILNTGELFLRCRRGNDFHQWWQNETKEHERSEFLEIMSLMLLNPDVKNKKAVQESIITACNKFALNYSTKNIWSKQLWSSLSKTKPTIENSTRKKAIFDEKIAILQCNGTHVNVHNINEIASLILLTHLLLQRRKAKFHLITFLKDTLNYINQLIHEIINFWL